MSMMRDIVLTPRIVKMIAAVVVGLSVGAMLPPEPVSVPAVGTVSGLIVGGVGVLSGSVLYVQGADLVGSSGCGCSGDCGCS